jgi:hypothetical protein
LSQKAYFSVSFGSKKIILQFYEPQETYAGLLLSFVKKEINPL